MIKLQLFVDNDIILKLSSAGLLQEIEKIFNTNVSSIFILPDARSYFSKSKRLKQKYSYETLDKALSAIGTYSVIPDEYIDQEKVINLSDIDDIDSGERILFSVKPNTDDYLILTGDKNAVIRLNAHPSLEHIKIELAGKIVCLEYILLKLIDRPDFDVIAGKIVDSNFCGDTSVKFVFNQTNLTLEKVKEGLNSYYYDLKSKTDSLLL